ncbi:MAG: flagellar basal-body MS-ring/collar protein FliF [bacterium]
MENKKTNVSAMLGIFNKLSIQQRMLIGGVLVVALVLLGFVVFIFNEPSYSTLYTNLAPEDANKIIEVLNAQKVTYKLEDGGQTIKVPKDKVYEMRLTAAGKGIPSSGIVGYEIFDQNLMGMSEFMQKLNFKRALEGELSRTIMDQNGVEGVRVHIVFPEKSIFKEDERPPTASIVLKLNSGFTLSKQNIVSISNLVASSVEGLQTSKVTIIDTRGRLLSKDEDENSLTYVSNKQYEIKSGIENYLANKAQTILDNVVGYGNSIVKVNVDLDFNQVEKTMETYDPESQVAISEQTVKQETGGKNAGDSTGTTSENSTTNYEISKTIERVIEGAGNIKRVTLAAVINGITKEVKNGDKIDKIIEPRPEAQLLKLEQIVKQSVGINDSRNDIVTLESIPFETHLEDDSQLTESASFNINEWSNLIMLFVAVGASLFILKGLMKKLKNEKILVGTVSYRDEAVGNLSGGTESGSSSLPQIGSGSSTKKKQILDIGDIEDEITDAATEKRVRQDKIVHYAQKNPTEAAKLINSWLREDEY